MLARSTPPLQFFPILSIKKRGPKKDEHQTGTEGDAEKIAERSAEGDAERNAEEGVEVGFEKKGLKIEISEGACYKGVL